MKTRNRIQAISKKTLPPKDQQIIVIWDDPDDPDSLIINGESMTRAEFEKRYPGPHTVIDIGDIWDMKEHRK